MARSTKREGGIQDQLITDIHTRIPGSLVFKIDHYQGYPDLLILYRNMWASLETKQCSNAHRQPNQPYYVQLMNRMSFSRFVYPENKEEVLSELCKAFGVG